MQDLIISIEYISILLILSVYIPVGLFGRTEVLHAAKAVGNSVPACPELYPDPKINRRLDYERNKWLWQRRKRLREPV